MAIISDQYVVSGFSEQFSACAYSHSTWENKFSHKEKQSPKTQLHNISTLRLLDSLSDTQCKMEKVSYICISNKLVESSAVSTVSMLI